jgi:hypothetical protein
MIFHPLPGISNCTAHQQLHLSSATVPLIRFLLNLACEFFTESVEQT